MRSISWKIIRTNSIPIWNVWNVISWINLWIYRLIYLLFFILLIGQIFSVLLTFSHIYLHHKVPCSVVYKVKVVISLKGVSYSGNLRYHSKQRQSLHTSLNDILKLILTMYYGSDLTCSSRDWLIRLNHNLYDHKTVYSGYYHFVLKSACYITAKQLCF